MKRTIILIFALICFFFEISNANANQTVNVPTSYKVNDTSVYNIINLTGMSVSVSGADPIQVVVTTTSGSIKISSTGGLTATSGYSSSQWSGNNEIAFYGSLASVNNALQTLAYQGSGTITVAASKPETYFSTSTGNFYYLDTTLGSTWSIAKALATSMTWSGARGYLATITTSAENSLLTTVTNNQNAWIDGSDSGTEGVWLWTNGPEAGTQFSYQANPSVQGGAVATQPGGTFWGPSNPNGDHLGDPGDDCIEFYGVQGTIYSNLWNDLDCGANTRPFVVEFSGSDVTTALKSFTISGTFEDPVVAFDAIKTEIESIVKNGAISNSVEQIKNSEFIMREKMAFHGEMMRAEPSTATTSFVDYNVNLNGDSFETVGDGKYHQTDIGGDQFRRRIMIDAKRVHSKNASVTQVVSALSLFDVGISKKTSSQYRFGFKQSNGKGSYPIKSSSKARAYRLGGSLSHSFNEKVFGGIFADLIYTQAKLSFHSAYTNVTGKIRTYSLSGGAQLSGQYEIYPEFWIKPNLSLSYSREYLIRKVFVSNTSFGSTVVEAALPMPTVFRITAEPEFLYESFANQDGTKDFVSINTSYACENIKSGTKVDACNTGFYFQIGKKSDQRGITGKFYASYENLNSGPKHEYGLQFKSDF